MIYIVLIIYALQVMNDFWKIYKIKDNKKKGILLLQILIGNASEIIEYDLAN